MDDLYGKGYTYGFDVVRETAPAEFDGLNFGEILNHMETKAVERPFVRPVGGAFYSGMMNGIREALAYCYGIDNSRDNPMALDQALDEISVMAVDAMDLPTRRAQNLDGWYAVTDEDGISAYFSTEKAALRWRLAEINRRLNG